MSVSDLTDSRAATDALLGILPQGRWSPQAVARFLTLAADRSVRQAVRRPRALTEITALHLGFLTLAHGRGRGWVAASWTLGALHLGMLEDRVRLSPADVLTLIRGNLPALAAGSGRWAGVVAIASDLADGHLARRQGTASPFGDYADSFADAAFWTWLVLRHEPSRAVRAAAITAWVIPVAAVTAASLTRGEMTDRPRPALLRPAATMQAIVAVRHLLRP
ncbi:CDP-alcohol phosphatidyltransferase family protein [Streptomyces sp. H39-S7]|uniref:CDP-alcohol phosphatidyltransferase family protein n=1 Tax=Streptomyces sp. H39-S7 TaxID=3004357 RepID=UPI0022AFD570|nr:CDP-alcohol phosphatidyltransferase family protein [Streptomyces sp. H39-S7]MCZ4126119.1 CDP-alcohol phosphatidyltransferase family protein [Streptomyces sp. H39-S7]